MVEDASEDIGSMGLVYLHTNEAHKMKQIVGKYTIHGSYRCDLDAFLFE